MRKLAVRPAPFFSAQDLDAGTSWGGWIGFDWY